MTNELTNKGGVLTKRKYNVKPKKATEKQKMVYGFIRDCISGGMPPTVREIGLNFKVSWIAAEKHCNALIKKGYIQRIPNISRGLKLLKDIDGNKL